MIDRPGINWEANIYVRVHHEARHSPKLRRNPGKAFRSLLREAGDFLWGAFLPVREAM